GVTFTYNLGERLVSYNIDVAEVRTFLTSQVAALDKDANGSSDNSEAKDQPKFSLVGEWKLSHKQEDGKTILGEGQFKEDGTFVLSPRTGVTELKARKGRYLYANSMLWLISDDSRVTLNVAWAGHNRFSCSARSTEVVFDRHKAE